MTKDAVDISSVILNNRQLVDRSKLVQLAVSDDTSELTKDLMSKDIPTQLRAFLLENAKAELVRIIKLTTALNKLEDKYIDRSINDMERTDMRGLADMIKTVSNSLNRSMNMIDQIVHDNQLKVIIDKSTKIINSTSNNVSLVTDKSSREKLRNITTKLLSALSSNPGAIVNASPVDMTEDNTDIIDAEVPDK